MPKTIEQINEKIARKAVRVVRADQMTEIVRDLGPDQAAEQVDVVTTGTFGAMCSSGAWLNFGHADPPIKMTRVWLNDVELYAGAAAVDAYLGATQATRRLGRDYGGAHVLEDLVSGKEVVLRAVSYGTDCYPRKRILTRVTLDDLNTALLANPRNGYQRYGAAANSSVRPIRTYMGTLSPKLGNVTYSGAGSLSPLSNDPEYRTIGLGTRIFLGGAEGYVTGPGTQHNPKGRMGTLAVQGDLKRMSAEFLRAASFPGYGFTLYIGLGIPIPILDADLARRTAVSDAEIPATVYDYGVASNNRPVLLETNYAELKSGRVTIDGRAVPSSPLSSFVLAQRVADELKRRIEKGAFTLTAPVERLPLAASVKPLAVRQVENSEGRAIDNASGSGVSGLRRDGNRCIHCGHCLTLCPEGVFSRAEDWTISAEPGLCSFCSLCVAACPLKALSLSGA
ncbi:MAG: 4Fe-4S dicluster domain-containing protein [Candidatus Aminicenantes bacterium]|nr:4Fe-4S dicluster domain-containing protein [Candidatus Aminicenantes bacterium]